MNVIRVQISGPQQGIEGHNWLQRWQKRTFWSNERYFTMTLVHDCMQLPVSSNCTFKEGQFTIHKLNLKKKKQGNTYGANVLNQTISTLKSFNSETILFLCCKRKKIMNAWMNMSPTHSSFTRNEWISLDEVIHLKWFHAKMGYKWGTN